MTTYDFQKQMAIGEAGEAALDTHFAHWFDIQTANADEQKHGIDRWFVSHSTGKRVPVEYKTDHRAHQTNHAFVEIDSGAIRGWALTSFAHWLIYYVPGSPYDLCYLIRMTALRAQLPRWTRECSQRMVQNKTYQTTGLLVPLREFERIAFQVVEVEN